MARLRDDDILRIIDAFNTKADPGPGDWLEKATHRRLVVHTVKGDTFEGTVTLVAADGLVLWAPQLVTDKQPVSLGGEVWIPKEQVHFVQTVRM